VTVSLELFSGTHVSANSAMLGVATGPLLPEFGLIVFSEEEYLLKETSYSWKSLCADYRTLSTGNSTEDQSWQIGSPTIGGAKSDRPVQ
jgi:hypothetical protein